MSSSLRTYLLLLLTLAVLVTYVRAQDACGIEKCEMCDDPGLSACKDCGVKADLLSINLCLKGRCGKLKCGLCTAAAAFTGAPLCTECAAGYNLRDGVCVEDVCNSAHCVECNDDGACLLCDEGYHLNEKEDCVLSRSGAALPRGTVAAVGVLVATAIGYLL